MRISMNRVVEFTLINVKQMNNIANPSIGTSIYSCFLKNGNTILFKLDKYSKLTSITSEINVTIVRNSNEIE